MNLFSKLARSQLLRTGVLVCAVLHFALQIVYWYPRQSGRHDTNRDVVVYYVAAQNVLSRQPLYDSQPGYGPDQKPGSYLYPPQFAAVLSPLARLSYHTFTVVWYAFLMAAFWTYAWCLCRLSTVGKGVRGALVWGLVVGLTPGAYHALSLGQVEPVLWALVGLAYTTRYRDALLAVTLQVKPYAAWALLTSELKDSRRTIWQAIAAIVTGCGLGVLVCGLHSFSEWRLRVVPVASQGTFDPANVSLSFAVLRVAHGLGLWRYTAGPLPVGPRLFLSVAAVCGPAATWFLLRRKDARITSISCFLAAMVCSPLCWEDYLLTGYLLLAAMAHVRYRGGSGCDSEANATESASSLSGSRASVDSIS